MPDSIDSGTLNAQFPEIKERGAARLGIMTSGYEREAWTAVYNPQTGQVDMAKATEQQMRRLGLAVERTNELIEKGIIHPDTVAFRECVKRQVPATPWGKARTKAEVCS